MAEPTLLANFELRDNAPLTIKGEARTHYRIRLSLMEPPSDILIVIYTLDSSYTNPIRMVTSGIPDYQEFITSYGDFEVRVAFRARSRPNEIQSLLSKKLSLALKDFYSIQGNNSPQIEEAIRNIEQN